MSDIADVSIRLDAQASDSTRLSLLEAARLGSAGGWQLLSEIYRPMIHHWSIQQGLSLQDAEDLSQEVFLKVSRSLDAFEHVGRVGAFRSWLRTITVNAARDLWRAQKRDLSASGKDMERWLTNLADEDSELSRQWDQQHDQYVLMNLLSLMELEFAPTTMQIFKRFALEGQDATSLAQEFHTTVGAIYTARSRILQRIRQAAKGLVDEL